MEMKIWLRQMARHWEEALPLGNGRLGAMLFGGGREERIALNEETFWSGYPRENNRAGAAAYYGQARNLALEGNFLQAQALVEDKLLGRFTQSYLPLGDLLLRHHGSGEAQALTRQLKLDTAVHETEYMLDGVRYTRTVFISYPDQALFLRVTADRPGALSLDALLRPALRGSTGGQDDRAWMDLEAPSNVAPSYIPCDDPIQYDTAPEKRGMRARVLMTMAAEGGRVSACGDGLRAEGADAVEIRLFARTSFHGYERQPFVDGLDEKRLCREDALRTAGLDWASALSRHTADYRALYGRVSLTLGDEKYSHIPTDERLRAAWPDDGGLCALLYQFGRYLLIASSRPGGEPANLQGIWNQDVRAIWSCNYTININTQMNYWAAEQAALPELCQPLFHLIADLCKTGRRTAQIHYGSGGAVAHHNTDLWRLANPVGEQYSGFAGCAFWPLGLGWLLRQLMEHDRYCPDDAFLRDWALEPHRLAARFFLDTAVKDRDGFLTIAPAVSPENQFLDQGQKCRVSARAAMTTQIMREVWENYLRILRRLNLKEPMAGEAEAALAQLAPLQTGGQGQALEWEKEFPEAEPEHRHISHLYALYPGESTDEKLQAAARQSLLLRGDEGTGWSLAWKTAAWARLGEGDHALRLLRRQLQPVEAGTSCNLHHGGSYISLLDAHPPFQIDGNFGACAAIGQMLLQERNGWITVLPALPSAWKEGSVRGLRAPGGVTVDFDFYNGLLTHLTVRRSGGKAVHLRGNGREWELPAGKAGEWRLL